MTDLEHVTRQRDQAWADARKWRYVVSYAHFDGNEVSVARCRNLERALWIRDALRSGLRCGDVGWAPVFRVTDRENEEAGSLGWDDLEDAA